MRHCNINQVYFGLVFFKYSVYNTKTVNIAYRTITMKRRTRSILEELSTLGTKRNTELLIENRGQSIIESAANLLSLIHESFSEDEANELERRFLNAIRTNDPRKFKRGVHKVLESRKTVKNTPEN